MEETNTQPAAPTAPSGTQSNRPQGFLKTLFTLLLIGLIAFVAYKLWQGPGLQKILSCINTQAPYVQPTDSATEKDEADTEETKDTETVEQTTPSTQLPQNISGATPACKLFIINSGKFASNKCYLPEDYDELMANIELYNDAVYDFNAAGQAMLEDCQGDDKDENKCDEDKADREEAQDRMDKYGDIIRGIITRGS